MQIRIKNDDTTRDKLLNDSIPVSVVTDILGKTFDAIEGSLFTIETEWREKKARWCIPPECAEVVSI